MNYFQLSIRKEKINGLAIIFIEIDITKSLDIDELRKKIRQNKSLLSLF